MKTEATEKEKIFSHHKHKSNHRDLEYIRNSQIQQRKIKKKKRPIIK